MQLMVCFCCWDFHSVLTADDMGYIAEIIFSTTMVESRTLCEVLLSFFYLMAWSSIM